MKRHLGLDVLRGIAILLVLFRHLWGDVGVLTPLKRGGWVGVDLFFVLSGFLVSGLIFREHDRRGTFDAWRFLVRRGLKIYPSYYVFLAVTALGLLATGLTPTLQAVAVHAFYLQNYLTALDVVGWPLIWGHTWSLAVEEQFYLLLAIGAVLACRVGGRRPFRLVPWLCAGSVVLCLVLRMRAALVGGVSYGSHLGPTHMRLDALMIGVLVAYLHHFHRERTVSLGRRLAPIALPVGLGLLGLPFVFDIDTRPWIMVQGFTATALGSALLVLVTISVSWRNNVVTTSLARIGRDSYSIYLWHVPVLHMLAPLAVTGLRRLTGIPFGVTSMNLVYFIASLPLGMFAARLIEWPILELRDRLWPSRATAPSLDDTAEPAADASGDPIAPAASPPKAANSPFAR